MEGTCPYPPPILANQIGDQIDPKLGIDQAGKGAGTRFSPSPCNVFTATRKNCSKYNDDNLCIKYVSSDIRSIR